MTSSGSSSSSDSQSDDDRVAPPPPPPPADLGAVSELAQICHFCATFRAPLKLSRFTRTELQAALLDGANPNESQLALLAELHFKLTRDQTGVKLERMIQDWEKAVARKLADNWQLEFASNPMATTSYAELSVRDRIRILNALCLWKAESCVEIRKYIATIQKDDAKAFDKLRGSEIGTDDSGVSYWYFDDGCWVYAEDKPQWQLETREPLYICEFANAKRIRLSINFDADAAVGELRQSPQPKLIAAATPSAESAKKSVLATSNQDENAAGAGVEVPEKSESHVVKRAKFSILNEEKEESPLPHDAPAGVVVAVVTATPVEPQLLPPVPGVKEEARPVSRKMDINMICGSPSSDDMSAKCEAQPAGNGLTMKVVAFSTNGAIKTEQQSNGLTEVPAPEVVVKSQPIEDSKPLVSVVKTEAEAKETKDKHEVHESVEPIQKPKSGSHDIGAKKRVLVDDDSSESSDVESAKKSRKSPSKAKPTSSPLKKKQKTEEAAVTTEETAPPSAVEKLDAPIPRESKDSAPPPPLKAVDTAANTVEASDKTAQPGNKKDETIAETNGAAEVNPAENFDVNCECCLKDYDMRYLDPPLVERPAGEWRCFECLVNDARGWPRRRKSTASPTAKAEAADEKAKSSSSKKSSSSSSAKRSRPSLSKSSSSKTATTSGSSSSKRKKSSGTSTSTSKKSSSSSSSKRKHKKKKSSSSSHSHHRSSSSSHHRRRHHQEYSNLLVSFRARNKERLAIEEERIHDAGRHSVALLDSPTSWRVVSSTLDSLRVLIETLAGGSLEQERLRSRLISVLKIQEKLEEERIKRQELAWQILPRRQSSRIAIGKMRNQSSGSDESEEDFSEEGTGGKSSRRQTQRSSTRTRSADPSGNDPAGVDSKQLLAQERASRARRRQIQEGMDGHGHQEDAEEDDESMNVGSPGDWINWSILKGNERSLSTVCLAAVNRLLKEEISELFARPVDPEFDGCPDYFTIITNPMDLGTIRTRVGSGFYKRWEPFKKDVERVWDNCRVFNGLDTMIAEYADTLEALFKQMCKVAEKRGARSMADDRGAGAAGDNEGSDAVNDDEDDPAISSGDESKAESRTSVNKEWTESSGSESSGSSDDLDSDNSSDGANGNRRSRSRAAGRANPKATRPSPTATSSRSSRTRARAATTTATKKKTARGSWKSDDDDDDESELSSSDGSEDEEDGPTRGRRSAKRQAPAHAVPARATRTTAAAGRHASPLSQKSSKRPPHASPTSQQRQKSADQAHFAAPPPPPPAAAPVQAKTLTPPSSGKSPRPTTAAAGAGVRLPKLRVSDSSSSDSDGGDNGSSSSSSSSSSDDSADSNDESDVELHSKPPQPKELAPTAATSRVSAPAGSAPAPPPPAASRESSPPPPPPSPPRAATAAAPPPPPPRDNGAPRPAKARPGSTSNASGGSNKRSKVSPRVAALKLDRVASLSAEGGSASGAFANSPTLLNSYLSPSSSSSSYFSSSGDSDSSDDNDSDSDNGSD